MELSAFAHMTRRNIKVIQPGLVYVIEWYAGGEPDTAPNSPQSLAFNLPRTLDSPNSSEREKRRAKRAKDAERNISSLQPIPDQAICGVEDISPGPVYVAYVRSVLSFILTDRDAGIMIGNISHQYAIYVDHILVCPMYKRHLCLMVALHP